MSLPQFLSSYLTLNLLLAGVLPINIALRNRIRSARLLQLNYFAISWILLAAFAQPLLPQREFYQPPLKVWAAASSNEFRASTPAKTRREVVALPLMTSTLRLDHLQLALVIFLLGSLGFGAYSVLRDARKLRALIERSFLIRRIGSVSIFCNDDLSIPFSIWKPGHSQVLIPSSLLSAPSTLRLAIAHELQHHRQRDTHWIYLIRAIQLLCFWNPLAHRWTRRLSEIQEYACDEALVDRSRVSPEAYASCLIQVAETALRSEKNLACATGFLFAEDGHLLKRRIDRMLRKRIPTSKWTTILIGATLAITLGGAAWASQGWVRDRRVTMEQAQSMARRTSDEFPVAVNEQVVEQLNRYIGTPEGRKFMREALKRMETHRPIVESMITEYGLPKELMALPLVESGYQNLPPKPDISKSAGVWQFIQTTAWAFGLNVWDTIDERLDIEKETDAAMRLLLSGRVQFKNWELSILAYNAGDQVVSKGILKTHSYDAWTLIQNGYEGDKNYLASVMAAVLILKNPESVEN